MLSNSLHNSDPGETAPQPIERWAGPRLAAACGTDAGRERENNEDGFYMLPDQGLFVVCDGMGGMAAGELATELALAAVANSLTPARVAEAFASGETAVRTLMREAVSAADASVKERQREARRLRGMGCTLVMALFDGARFHIANLGDSRAYLIRQDEMRLLSVNHTYAAELVRMGELTEAQARRHPMRHQLTVAVGHMKQDLGPDDDTLAAYAGDRLLLCSDGLWDMVEEADMAKIVREAEDPGQAVERLIAAANAAGGEDNITAVVVACHAAPPSAASEETGRRV